MTQKFYLNDAPAPKYDIIYADCPWSYNDKKIRGGAEHHYETMSVEDLCKLPVGDLASDNCALFMWGTYPTLPDCFKVMEAWGFKYKTLGFQWVKVNKRADTAFVGLGHWTRGNSEPCFLAVRGKPKRISKSVRQIVETEVIGGYLDPEGDVVAAKIQAHSVKPDEVRNRIVTLLGDLPRVELFSRLDVPGWASFGDQAEGTNRLVLREVP